MGLSPRRRRILRRYGPDDLVLPKQHIAQGRTPMRLLKFALAAIAAVVSLGAARAEPVKIRMAWVAPVSNWASIVLEKQDLAKHIGKSYTVEAIRFAGTPPMMTAIATGELEIANLAYSTFPLAVQNASLDDLRASPTNSRTASRAMRPTNGPSSRTAPSRRSRT
jgi:ABC-type nitrate/sulfonate/bicarbonate transport system substrate-binding protein